MKTKQQQEGLLSTMNNWFIKVSVCFLFLLVSSAVVCQKQVAVNINTGVSMIDFIHPKGVDTATQGVAFKYDVGFSYRVYINNKWTLSLGANYGRFHGKEKFDYIVYDPRYTLGNVPVGSIKGYTIWWFKNLNFHTNFIYTKKKFGFNIGFRVVKSDFIVGRRQEDFYDLSGGVHGSKDKYASELKYNKVNYGPTYGIQYVNKSHVIFYMFYYGSMNYLKYEDPVFLNRWKLKQLVIGVSLPIL